MNNKTIYKIMVEERCSYCSGKVTMQMDKEEYQEYIEFMEDNGYVPKKGENDE